MANKECNCCKLNDDAWVRRGSEIDGWELLLVSDQTQQLAALRHYSQSLTRENVEGKQRDQRGLKEVDHCVCGISAPEVILSIWSGSQAEPARRRWVSEKGAEWAEVHYPQMSEPKGCTIAPQGRIGDQK